MPVSALPGDESLLLQASAHAGITPAMAVRRSNRGTNEVRFFAMRGAYVIRSPRASSPRLHLHSSLPSIGVHPPLHAFVAVHCTGGGSSSFFAFGALHSRTDLASSLHA